MGNIMEDILEDMDNMKTVTFGIDKKTLDMLNDIKGEYKFPNQATTVKYLIREKHKILMKRSRRK